MSVKTRLAILASGAGSNARNIIDYFSDSAIVEVALVASNRAEAGVLEIARENEIETFLITRENFRESTKFLDMVQSRKIDFIILAGFLWKVPDSLISAFDRRIINIHPALLPKYGGKGMYGHFVHEAVHAAREKESGITIHYVDGHYDAGDVIFQTKVSIDPDDDANAIEQKVRALEIRHYPVEIAKLIE
jgi:phosphoribosylglycinamide formyltransferase-1